MTTVRNLSTNVGEGFAEDGLDGGGGDLNGERFCSSACAEKIRKKSRIKIKTNYIKKTCKSYNFQTSTPHFRHAIFHIRVPILEICKENREKCRINANKM